jgi:hypothetical protein
VGYVDCVWLSAGMDYFCADVVLLVSLLVLCGVMLIDLAALLVVGALIVVLKCLCPS